MICKPLAYSLRPRDPTFESLYDSEQGFFSETDNTCKSHSPKKSIFFVFLEYKLSQIGFWLLWVGYKLSRVQVVNQSLYFWARSVGVSSSSSLDTVKKLGVHFSGTYSWNTWRAVVVQQIANWMPFVNNAYDIRVLYFVLYFIFRNGLFFVVH